VTASKKLMQFVKTGGGRLMSRYVAAPIFSL